MSKNAVLSIGNYVEKDEKNYHIAPVIIYGAKDSGNDLDSVTEMLDNFMNEKYPELPKVSDYLNGEFDFNKTDEFKEAISEVAEVVEVPDDGWCLDEKNGNQFIFPIDKTEFSLEDFYIQVNKDSEITINNLVAYFNSFSITHYVYMSEKIFFALIEINGQMKINYCISDTVLYSMKIKDIINDNNFEDFELLDDNFEDKFHEFCEQNHFDEFDFIEYDNESFNKDFIWVE